MKNFNLLNKFRQWWQAMLTPREENTHDSHHGAWGSNHASVVHRALAILVCAFMVQGVWGASEVKLVSVGMNATQTKPSYLDNNTVYKSADESYSVTILSNGVTTVQGGSYTSGDKSVKDYYYYIGNACDLSADEIQNYLAISATGCKITKVIVRAHSNSTSTAIMPAIAFDGALPAKTTIGSKSGRAATAVVKDQSLSSYGTVKTYANAADITFNFSSGVGSVYFSKQMKQVLEPEQSEFTGIPKSNSQAPCIYGIEVYVIPSGPTLYTATFNANGGEVTPTSATQASAGASITLPTPTRSGYTCTGWYTAASGGTKCGDAAGTYVPTANEALYAQWDCAAPTDVAIGGESTWHIWPKGTLKLISSASNLQSSPTYTWKKGGTTVEGQTGSTLTINNCTKANTGSYTVTVANGTCEATSSAWQVKMLQSYLKNNDGTDIYNAPLTKIDATTAQIEFDLSGNTTYRFNITDGCGNWYGNDGTMTSANCSDWTFNSSNDCRITTTKAGTYTVRVNYSNMAQPVVSVIYPSSNQAAGYNIYFDNTDRQWASDKIYYRIGKSSHNHKIQMTKVSGTANLYKVTTAAYDGFDAWHIANNGCWSEANSIYKTNTGDANAATEAIAFQGNAVVGDMTIVPTSDHSTGGDSDNNNCEFYGSNRTSGLLTHTATITTPTNGTITVAYTDVDNAAQSFTSGNASLAHTCILTITATPAAGYSLSTLKVNGDAFTSGNTHILSADATIAATFAANQYTVTLNTNGGTINAGNIANYIYGTGATLPTNVTKDGFTFDGWFDNSGLTGSAVTTIANNATGNKEYWAKWTAAAPEPVGDCSEIGYGTSTTITLSATSGDLTLANSGASLAGSNMAPFSGATNMKPIQLGGATKYITGSLGGNEIESLKVSVSTSSTSNRVFAVAFSSASSFDSENLVEVAAGATIRTFSANGTSETRTDFDIEAPAGAKSFAISRNFTSGTIKAGDPAYTNSGNRYLYYIKACAKEACTGSDAELAYGTTAVNKTEGDAAFVNALTNPHSVAVTYTSTNTSVATVAADGTVTIVAAGSTTIKAASAEQTISETTYCADEVSYTLTVTAAPADAWSMYTATSTKVGDFRMIDANTFKLEGFELSNSTRYDICFKNNSTQYYVNSNNCDITTKSALVEASNTFNFNTAPNGTYDITITKENGTWYIQAVAAEPTYTVTVNSSVDGHDCSKNLSAKADQTVTITNTCEVPGYTLTGYTSTPEVSGTFNAGTYTFTMPASNVTLDAVWESGCAAPIITSQSEDQVGIKVGQNNVTISVATSTDNVTYQWYRCNSEGEILQTISGATNSTYTIAAGDQHIGVYYYKCTLTHTCAEGTEDATSELISLQFVPADFIVNYTLKASKSSGSETDLKSAATASVSQISSLSGVSLNGSLTATNNQARTGLTAKIGNLGAAKVDADYVSLNFNVADDYYLLVSAVRITVQPVTCNDQVYYAELEDEFGTKITGTVSNITNGNTGELVFTYDGEKQFKGNVTLKLWAWDPNQSGKTYRLSTSLTIGGTVNNEPLPGVVRTITFHDGANTDTQDVPDNVATALKAMNTIGWSKTGQTFAGWAETEGGVVAYADRADITITADKDLYAKWTKNQYTVTLDNQEATTAGTASVTVTYDSKANLESAITVPTKTNNEFGGYYTAKNGAGVQVIAADGTFNKDNDYLKADGNWKYLGNVTLYAKWTSTVATYAITYDANGGTGTMTAAREYEAGAEVTIKTNAFTAPANKEFAGWVVTDASSNVIEVNAGKFTMPAAAVTITAQWRDKEVSGDCHTMVIWDGSTMSTAPGTKATGSDSYSGATWTNVTTGTSVSSFSSKSYGGKSYTKSWTGIGGTTRADDRHIQIVIPSGYSGVVTVVGTGSSGRSIFIANEPTGTKVTTYGYVDVGSNPAGLVSAQLSEGTYYICATNTVAFWEVSVEVCPVAAGCKAPTISAVNATPAAVCAGEEVTLSATATQNNAGSLTYTWFNSDNIEMGTGASVTVNPEENTTYYCVVAEEGCDKTAKSSTVSVSINAATAITTQPTAATEASVGETVSLSVVATGSHLSHQWQESADGSEWADMPVLNATAKQATLSVKVATVGTMYYRCVVSGDCGEETSSLATVTAGAAAPTVTWSDVTTVYQGEKVSISVTTNTDADFDESALTISAGNCTVESKTVVGKTVVAELHINADAAADAEITLTFNTVAGASYGATVNNTHTLTVSGECPTGGESGTIYTATISGQSTIGATGGEAEVSYKMNGSPKTLNSNSYYKFDSNSKLKFTPTGGFLVGDVLTFNLISSGNNTDGVKISNAAGTQLADLTTALSASENRTITYTFTAATDFVTVMRHNSSCYFYSATVDRVGSLTNLDWNDTEDMIEDGVVTVAPEAENFTIAAVSNNSFGAITYSIAPAGVAAINASTGEIDPVANGTATVTATIAANGCYGAKSITYTLKVADNCEAPVISAHPASATYEVNTTASAMSVTATGSELTYQWYSNSENNNTSGTAIGGATSASYTPDVTVRGTTYYYCEVKSGKCGTLSNVATIEVTRPACALAQPKIIEVSRVGGDCWTSITLKAVEQNGDALDGGTYQWYLDGEAFSTAAQPTITVAGTYTLEYTKDECTVDASNEFVAESTNPEVGLLSPFQYYHAGKSDYSDQMNGRHLFTYISLSDAEPSYTATLNEVAMTGDALTTLQGALERVSGKNNVDTIMLSLNDLVGCGFAAGDEVVITVTPKNCSGAEVAGEAKSIQLHVVDGRPTLAFIVSGADGDGTKVKKNLKLNGDFLTGYNKADLKVQSAKETVTAAELPLYTALKENYNVVPVNGYAPFSKWNYEPFDLTFLTDFVKTDGGSDKAAAKEKVNQLAGIVDFRPMFSTKSFMSGISNWTKLGFTANPVAPKKTQQWMNIVCYAHPMFEQFLNQEDIVKEDQGEGNYEVVFTMLSQGGFDASKGIQGFKLSDVSAFVNIATTHYNASANIDYVNHTCTPGEVGADDELLIASCERQKNIEARMIMLSVNADATSFLTDEGIEVIILSLSYLLETDPIKVTDCSFTFEGDVDDDWNKPANWDTDKLPTVKNNVRIAAPCVVKNGERAVAASVKILRDKVGENGSLTIEPTGALQITGTINRIEGGQYMTLLPTHVEDVTILSSASGNGAYIGNEKGDNKATVQMWSPATGTDGGNYDVSGATWQWMTTPFNDVSDAQQNYYGAWMFEYVNASHGWAKQILNGMGMTPFTGYSVTYGTATDHTYSMTGTLVAAKNQSVPLTYTGSNGINLVGNSWTAPITISKFQASDFTNADATVIMFNTGYDPTGSGDVTDYTSGTAESTDVRTAGTYVSIPIGVASVLPDALKTIPSMQAFQVNATGSGAKLTLDYNRLIVPEDYETSAIVTPMRAPSRMMTDNDEVENENGINEVLRIYVKGNRYSDFLYLFQKDETSMDYDAGYDGKKVMTSNYDIPVLCVRSDANYQMSTQPQLSGTQLAFWQGEDNQYTIGFDYRGTETLWLYDSVTDSYTEVNNSNTYTFTSNTTRVQKRFSLTDYNPNAPYTPTDLENVTQKDKVEKFIQNDKMFIRVNGHLYNAQGKLVR